MTAPAQEDRLTAEQLAALLALVKAQAAVRQRLTNTAVAAAVAAFQAVSNWWSAEQINEAIALTRRILLPTQQQAARITASYMAQTSGVIAGRTFRPAKTTDVAKLRKDMTADEANELLDGIRVPAWVLLGDSHDGPAASIDDPAELAAAAEPQWLDPADPYGRVADGYRYNVVMRGDSEDVARQKAMVRVQAVAQTDVTLAVRKQYQESMSAHGAIGFRRILHPELSETGPCALCVVAADRTYRTEDLLPIHSYCVCETLPIYEGADPGLHLNGDDLRALYEAAGGNTRQTLRKVTVALAEHAELGPILVDADQNNRGPVEVAASKTDRARVRYLTQLEALERLHDTTKYRIGRGDDLGRSFRAQADRIEELKRLTGVS